MQRMIQGVSVEAVLSVEVVRVFLLVSLAWKPRRLAGMGFVTAQLVSASKVERQAQRRLRRDLLAVVVWLSSAVMG